MYESEELYRLLLKCEETAERGPVIPGTGCYSYCVYHYNNFRYIARYGYINLIRVSSRGSVKVCQLNKKTSDDYDYYKSSIMNDKNFLYHRLIGCMLFVDGFDLLCNNDYTINHMATQDIGRASDDFLRYRNSINFLEIVPSSLNDKHYRFIKYHRLWGTVVSAYDINKFEKLFAVNDLFQDNIEEKIQLVDYVYSSRVKGDERFSDFKNPYLTFTKDEVDKYIDLKF